MFRAALVLVAGAAAVAVALGARLGDEAAPPGPRGLGGGARFVSRPDLRPARVRVLTRQPGVAAGKIFVAPKVGPHQAGPMILDDRGRMVWFRNLPGRTLAFDFRAQRLNGKPVLTWWQGRVIGGHGVGYGVIADSHYRVIKRVRPVGFPTSDLHEFKLTPRGTALMTIYHAVPMSLSSVGGPRDGHVVDSIVQEVDLKTGRLLFEWRSLAHVGIEASYKRLPDSDDEPYDYFHVNSIEIEPDGNLLISGRNTAALYELDRRTGAVLWRVGGKTSDFAPGPGVAFFGQHDARRLSDGDIALFDNGFPPKPSRPSRVIVLRLDVVRRTVSLVHTYLPPTPTESSSQGGAQPLPNGDLFVAWGSDSPHITEFGPAGQRLFDARFATRTTTTYRAYRLPWRGSPLDPPAVAARRDATGTTVYASWNGATQVRGWRVFAGRRPGRLRPVRRAPWTGFETAIRVSRRAPYVAVQALGRGDSPLRRSKPVRVRR